MALLTWLSGGLLAVLGIALAIAARGAGRGSDAAGRGLAQAYTAFAALLWLALAALFGIGVATGVRWLTAAPLLVVAVPAAAAVLRGLCRALFRARSRMPTRGLRALERAAADGHGARAKEIVASGVRIPDVETGRSLLRTALQGGYPRDVVDVLLEAGADPRSPDLLAPAMESRHTSGVPLVKHGASPDTVLTSGDTLVFAATDPGSMHVVEALLEAGADPSVPGPDGTTLRDVFARIGPCDLHPDHADALRARLAR